MNRLTIKAIALFALLASGAAAQQALPQSQPSPKAAGPALPPLRRAADVPGLLVRDSKGDEVGKLVDAAVDPKNGRLLFVVIEAGAYTRKADRLSAVPAPLLKVEGDHLLLPDVSRGKLAASHALNLDRTYWTDTDNQQWVELVWRYFGLEPYWPAFVDPTIGPALEPETPMPQIPRGQRGDPGLPQRRDPAAWQFVWLSTLRGLEVQHPEEILLGLVEDVIVDLPDQRVEYAVLKPRAALIPETATPPAAERLLVVPYASLLHWDGRLHLNYQPSLLADAPFIPAKPSEWPPLTRDTWKAGVGEVYGKRPEPPSP
ncbi:MAG: PRC-barrel domain-containing protein [Planctomycetota bacterium]